MASRSKRTRRPDFSQEELEIMIKLMVQHNDVLQGKFSNTLHAKDKTKLQQEIVDSVNAVGKHGRTWEGIKGKWSNIKFEVKQKAGQVLNEQRKVVRRTGGGEAETTANLEDVLTELEMLVFSIIPKEQAAGIILFLTD